MFQRQIPAIQTLTNRIPRGILTDISVDHEREFCGKARVLSIVKRMRRHRQSIKRQRLLARASSREAAVRTQPNFRHLSQMGIKQSSALTRAPRQQQRQTQYKTRKQAQVHPSE